ncbi:MAG: MipA/OmpV family protein [Burkholderiaceae bacterium]|nr:MipA/OmpV family protein [Burkholderiaceae bacterium]
MKVAAARRRAGPVRLAALALTATATWGPPAAGAATSAPPTATPVAPVAEAAATADAQTDAAPTARQPLWEAGLGLAVLHLPDYRGSARSRNLQLPLPYLVYRGDWLRADRDGARAVLLDTRRVELDLSVGGTAPAASADNPRRTGMADLPPTVEIGPNLNLTLWRAERGRARLDLRLPLRAVFTLERRPRAIGGVFEPVLNLDQRLDGGWNLGLQAGVLAGSRSYHRHFYTVASEEARADRPAYAAGGGRAGWQALAALSRRQGAWWYGAFWRHDDLRGAVFVDSPLVERRRHWSAGLGLSWVFAASDRRVSVSDPFDR